MKLKFFAVLMVVFSLSSCGAMNDFNGLFSDKEVAGADSLFSDNTFKDIPTHDSIDCSGSCTVKVYNR